MRNALYCVLAALCLTACASTSTPEQVAQRAAYAKVVWCGLPLDTRQRLRAEATDGLQLIVCPGDVQ